MALSELWVQLVAKDSAGSCTAITAAGPGVWLITAGPGPLWWLSEKESTCQCRRPGGDLWPGKIPQDLPWEVRGPQLLSLGSRAGSCNHWAHVPQLLKPVCPRACALKPENPLEWEAYALQIESSPPVPQLEKKPQQQQRPTQQSQKRTQWIKLFFFKKLQDLYKLLYFLCISFLISKTKIDSLIHMLIKWDKRCKTIRQVLGTLKAERHYQHYHDFSGAVTCEILLYHFNNLLFNTIQFKHSGIKKP